LERLFCNFENHLLNQFSDTHREAYLAGELGDFGILRNDGGGLPVREKGCLPKWHRLKLERDIARRHGLQFTNSVMTEDVTQLI